NCDIKLKKFQELVNKKSEFKVLFQDVIVNQDRNLCKDKLEFGVAENIAIRQIWEKIKEILNIPSGKF
ncbi:MAG: hypothetical protein DSY46_03610, partial [Hydrogenimonas sp.]